MSRKPLLSVALAASLTALSTGAFAAGAKPHMEAAFGNTVESIYPDGRSQKIWLHPDGVWTGQSRRGTPLAGRWTIKGDKVCLRQTKPPTLPLSFCQTFPDNPEVGVFSKDLTGTPIRLKIVKGMVGSKDAEAKGAELKAEPKG